MTKRTKEEWLSMIEQWRSSGKTIMEWCREHQIPKNSFLYWVHRKKKVTNPVTLAKESFVELKHDLPIETPIEVKFQECNIILFKNFDTDTFIKCLKALRESRC